MSENARVIERFFQAISEQDLNQVLDLYVEDGEFIAPARLPWGGHYKSHDGIKELFAKFASHWEEVDEVAERIIVNDDDYLAAVVRLRGTTKAGKSVDTQICTVYQMRDGRVLRGQVFADPATIDP